MWETLRLSTGGSFTLRKIALILLAVVLLSASFATTLFSRTTYADGATWSGDNISYGGKTYTPLTPAPTALPGIDPLNTQMYQSKDGDNVSIIAIKPNPDKTKAISDAQIAPFKLDAGNNYSSAGPPQALSIAASAGGAGTSGQATASNSDKSSCAVPGIGWIVCTTSRFFADAMDKAYGWIADFLVVKPLTTDTTSGLYQAWDIARGIANACFIIAFMVIIYSQITSYGISNYEIKKMIPKLIIAAITVNVSYYICSIAVDVSNILGDSVQKALIDVRNSLPAPAAQTSWGSWGNLATFVLSGGALGTIGIAASGGVLALVPLLVPVLIGGILSVFVALMVLAARQALIIVLIVLSPLAFVAYLLPNTEAQFKKWRELFTNMLMIFPMFSLLFGGSQLASYIIIQSTDQISVVILAMLVQVAPLAITPFLMRISHNLLTQLGGFMNNPKKGVMDRTRNWAKDRSDYLREQQIAKGSVKSPFTPSGLAYRRARGKYHRDNERKQFQTEIAAAVAGEDRAHESHVATKNAELRQSTAHAAGDRLFEERKVADAALTRSVAQNHRDQAVVKAYQTAESAALEEAKSDKMRADNRFASYQNDLQNVLRDQKIADGKVKFAQSEQSDEWAKKVIGNEALQAEIGGIGGADRALAQATFEFRKNYGDRIGEGEAVIKHWNLSGADRQAHALGKEVWVDDGRGNFKIFRRDSVYTREAAIDTQLRQGTLDEVEQILKVSGSELKDYKTTIASAVAEARLSQKAVYLGGQTIDMLGQGLIVGDAGLNQAVVTTMRKGKISASALANGEALGLERIFNVISNFTAAEQAQYAAEIESVKQAAYEALTLPSLKGGIQENARGPLNDMLKSLPTTQANNVVRDPDGNFHTIDMGRTY